MAVTIDALELKITHESEGAVKALDTLIETLNKLKEAAGMGGDLATVANGIKAMVKAASSVPARTPIEKVMKNITKAAEEAAETVQEAKEKIEVPFFDSHDPANNPNRSEIDEPRFAPAPDTERWSARSAEIQGFVAVHDAAIQQFMDGNKKGEASTKQVTEAVRQAGEAADEMRARLGTGITGEFTREEYSQIKELSGATEELSDDLEDLGNEMNDLGSDFDGAGDDVEEYEDELEDVEDELDELGDELDETGDDIDEMGDELDDLEDDMDDADEEIEEHESLISRLGHSYRNSRSGLDKFLQTVKRLVVMRAIRAAIREVAKGFSEGLENLYHYSEAMNSMDSASAKNSLDSVSTSLLWMKNSVGAAVAPLIQSLVPVLQTVVTWAVQAANAINMFISTLQGKTTYTKATEKATDMFDSIKSSAGGASKAAKEARATLLAFDEVNRLDAPDKGAGGGGGGGGGLSAKDYLDMFDEAAIELPTWMQWIIDNMDGLLSMIKDVGIALAAWVITTETINGISKVVSMLQSMTGLQKALAGGLLFAIGIKWAYEGGEAFGQGTAGIVDYIKTGLGIALAGIGGAMVGSIFGPGGAIIGLTIGIIASLVAFQIGIEVGEKAKLKNDFEDQFNKSLAGQRFQLTQSHTQNLLSMSTQLKLDIDEITGRIDSKTEAKLNRAADLIEEIFGLDSIKEKTTTEIELLKRKVEEFNGLNLEGIRIEFDTAEKKITTTKDAVVELLKKMRERYQLEAYNNALIRSYEALADAQYGSADAENNLKAAQQELNEYEKKYILPTKQALEEATIREKEASDKFHKAQEDYWWGEKEYNDAQEEHLRAVYALRDAQQAHQEVLDVYGGKYEELKKTVNDAETSLDNYTQSEIEAYKKVQYFSNILDGATKSTNNYKIATNNVNTVVGDTYRMIQQEAMKAAGAIGKIDDQDMGNVHKQLQTVKKDLEALAKKYTVKFEYPKGVTGATGYYGQGTMRAAGGYPSVGELFIANEAGPELIGTVNGRTAVAPNAEITGIANAVYTMGEREIAAINNLTRALNAKDMTAVVTADSIVAGLARKNRRDGVSTVPVSI